MGKNGARIAGGILAAALTATGCGSAAPMSATAAASATGPAADAALVCHHYMTQRAWIRSLAKPTLADALKAQGFIAADLAESAGTGKLHADLAAEHAAAQAGKDISAEAQRVRGDCAAIGVTSG